MKNRTLRIIMILVGLLFLNIEAAHAGLVQKIRSYILQEFPDHFLLGAVLIVVLLLTGFLYIIFAPVLIGNEKWDWLNYYSYQPGRHDYQNKRASIRKISGILNSSKELSKQAHS